MKVWNERKIKVLELFAGSRSFSNLAEELGFDTYCTDIQPFDGIDQVCNIFDFDQNKIPFKPDIVWASIPCTTFSVASISAHWTGGKKAYIPKTDKAIEGLQIVKKTLSIIKSINPIHYYIENPRGILRKMPFMEELPRQTVTYCSYGDTRMKPTDIWTDDDYWTPRKMCHNGNRDCHHEPAPRGSRTGTQGLANNYERSKIPQELCREILNTLKIRRHYNGI